MKKKSNIIYSEDIYPSYLMACKGSVVVQSNFVVLPDEMPVMIFAWWRYPGKGIVSMSHQSLQ